MEAKGEANIYSFPDMFRDYWLFLKGRRLRFIFLSILRSLSTAAGFGITFCLGAIVDFFTQYTPDQSLTDFYLLVAAIALLGTAEVWLRFFAKFRLYAIAQDIRREARILAMGKLMDLDMQWHEKEETGSKIQRVNHGSEQIYEAMHQFANVGIEILINMSVALILFIALSPKYVAFALAYSVIYLTTEYFMSKRIVFWQENLDRIKEKVSGKVHESASNILTVKSLGLKDSFVDATIRYEQQYQNVWERKQKTGHLRTKTVKILSALGFAGFILMAGFDALTATITAGSVYVFASYFNKLKQATHTITHRMDTFIKVKSAIGRFMSIVGTDTLERNSQDLAELPKDWKVIKFCNVWFRYKDKQVLRGLNLTIPRNQRIGIVGRSGCGKSTIVKLLLGLYTPQRGAISIDGIPLDQYCQISLTRNMAVVLQDSEMFNDSLQQNIAVSGNGIDKRRITSAIDIAALKSIIRKLPKGLDTLIGEKGYKVSGGERQRIGIARAIYKDAPILLLDEATSHLDSRTEARIQSKLGTRLKHKTLLLIAHRLSTLKGTDSIVVMDKGRIVDQGSFKDLKNRQGIFGHLYYLQIGH